MSLKKSFKSNRTRRKIAINKYLTSNSSLLNFQKEITVIFMEMLIMVKLYHWKTHSYATHKATDELYTKFNEHIDRFIEVLLGKTGSRIDLMSHKNIKLIDLNTQESFERKIKDL
jgi:DNA-binding ferritin-like protein